MEIPNSVTSIGRYAFDTFWGLKSITFADNSRLTSIGEGAFSSCDDLKTITIPDSVISISRHAFYGCTRLTSITFGGTMKQWNQIIKKDFWNYNVPATEVICSDGVVPLN